MADKSNLVVPTKATQAQLEALHGDLYDIYKGHLERLKESAYAYKVVSITNYDYNTLKGMIDKYVEMFDEDELLALRSLIGLCVAPITKDDIALMRNIQTFLKENEIHSDFKKKASLASLGKLVLGALEDRANEH